MSCGTKLEGRYFSHQELADDIYENGGSYTISRKVRDGYCLSDYELREARSKLEDADKHRYFDFRENQCACCTLKVGMQIVSLESLYRRQ